MSVGAGGDVAAARRSYRQAVAQVVEPSAAWMVDEESRSGDLIDRAVGYSEDLRLAIVFYLDGTPEEREVAALQLNEAAVVDLSVADYLAGLTDTTGGPTTPSAQALAREAVERELEQANSILRTPPGTWPPMILGGAPSPPSHSDRLKLEAANALNSISDDAAHAAQEVFLRGVLGLALPDVLKAGNTSVKDVFHHVADAASRLKRHAVQFVLKAMEKLFAVFGPEAMAVPDPAVQWVQRWTVAKTEALVRACIRDLYEIPQIETSLVAEIDRAENDAHMAAASDELVELSRKFKGHMQVLETVARLLRRVSGWLVALTQVWGYVGLAAAYLAGTAFAVLAGGTTWTGGTARTEACSTSCPASRTSLSKRS
jgi:hypothetical protein